VAKFLTTEQTLIKRQGLHDAVADLIRQRIVEGVLTPGARLNERILCEQMGVSRTPMREAIKKLAGEGLVRLEPNRGAVVYRLSADEVVAAFEVISRLEAISGELAARRASDTEILAIQKLQLKMESAHQVGDLSRYYRINAEIHDAINAAARNPSLQEIFRSVNLRLQSLRFRSNLDQKKWDKAVKEHAEIAKALTARDGVLVAQLLLAHVNNKREIVLKLLEQES
jgi:DNA-binding GntR family transcriptional regulator